jgi:predicted outer membrane repeat protein
MPHSFDARVRSAAIGLALTSLGTAAAVHAQQPPPPRVLYVDASALPGGDGSDWLHAFRDLQDALAVVPSNPGGTTADHYEIHISQGIYRPDRGTLDRSASFVVNSAATLIGGFGGLLSPFPDQTDGTNFISVLSGDLRGDDAPNFGNVSDNSYHVVRLSGAATIPGYTPPAYYGQLSGLTIAGGNADGAAPDDSGAGVLAAAGFHVGISGCTIQKNRAVSTAGADLGGASGVDVNYSMIQDNLSTAGVAGLLVGGTNNLLSGCLIARNRSSGNPGGLLASNVQIYGCTIVDNTGSNGAGANISGAGSIMRSTIAGNVAASEGGGVVFNNQSTYSVLSSLIVHNTAPYGAGISSHYSSLDIANCTLARNAASSRGGAIDALTGTNNSIRVWNSILWSNTAPHSANLASSYVIASIDHSILQNGAASASGVSLGAGILTSDPRFVNPTGTSPAPTSWADKDYRIGAGSPAIDAGDEPSQQVRDLYSDVGGSSRMVNSTCAAYARIDLGAFEFQGFACPPIIPVTYVRANAPAGGDGRSWYGAFRGLQDALSQPGVTSIWIAQGVYTPDRGTFDPSARFRIEKPFVSLYGGFAGTEASLSQRDISAHPTVLSADLLGNDSDLPASRLDNASCILQVLLPYGYFSGPGYPFTLSGLTFRGGNSADADRADDTAVLLLGSSFMGSVYTLSDCAFIDNRATVAPANTYAAAGGGALRASGQSLSLERCRFVGNTSARLGGAIYTDAALTATDCEFTANQAFTGGGAIAMYDYGASSTLRRCSFVANAAIGQGLVRAGAVLLGRNGSIDSCRFLGNVAFTYGPTSASPSVGAQGGAVAVNGYDSTSITNSLFAGNRCAGPGATGSAVQSSEYVSMINCTVADNAAAATLGGVASAAAVIADNGEMSNCIFWNSAPFGASALSGFSSRWSNSFTVHNCIVQSDPPLDPSSPPDPRFANPAGLDGIVGTADDDYSLSPNSPAIDAADSSLLPATVTLDLAGNPRRVDAFGVPNTGSGTPNYLDIGAYEFARPHTCAADFNGSGALTAQDIFDFLNAWFNGSPNADFNNSGSLSPQDIFDFLNAWFNGC